MQDKREEILSAEHWKLVKESGMQSIHTKHFPLAYKEAAVNAMDEYATEMCLDLLKYMSEKGVECDNEKSEGIFWLNGKWVSAKQLFENFL